VVRANRGDAREPRVDDQNLRRQAGEVASRPAASTARTREHHVVGRPGLHDAAAPGRRRQVSAPSTVGAN
jgi:hypothetical protein